MPTPSTPPLTEARIARFVRAMSKADPSLTRFRMTRDGDLIAERADIEPAPDAANYDAIDFGGSK
ncbi:hypothetical protein [Paracoccus sp. SM22M-07]|uniref:hypothetical protein n=1 Tax=Paracoccus sp. SM22M-07 TaxID=1520813 RepID=UPI000917F74B|nr:hypothetical protein [Paracoccus sp. SM22M-07]OJH45158.1 hypothetical protein IE00_05680 [Paracoccus sp. SM22M-07]